MVMKTEILVSIIINNYNYDRFLSEAIDSALSQSYPHTEVIVVDDGSTDNSRKIIASYDNKIIPILQENGKQAVAFNSGFVISKGEIIIFLDSDDYLFPHAVERIAAIWKPQLAKVHYRLNVVDTFSQPLGYSCPQGTSLSRGEVWRNLLEVGGYASTPTSGNALNRKALEQVFPIPTGDRFQRFVLHDLQNYSLLSQKANELGYKLPKDLEQRAIGRLWSRIISLRLDPQNHPIPSDRSLSLVYKGIRSLWKYSHFNWQKRTIYSIWFVWVGFMPVTLAKPAITWLYAPHFRPKAIAWIIKKIQSRVNRAVFFASKT